MHQEKSYQISPAGTADARPIARPPERETDTLTSRHPSVLVVVGTPRVRHEGVVVRVKVHRPARPRLAGPDDVDVAHQHGGRARQVLAATEVARAQGRAALRDHPLVHALRPRRGRVQEVAPKRPPPCLPLVRQRAPRRADNDRVGGPHLAALAHAIALGRQLIEASSQPHVAAEVRRAGVSAPEGEDVDVVPSREVVQRAPVPGDVNVHGGYTAVTRR